MYLLVKLDNRYFSLARYIYFLQINKSSVGRKVARPDNSAHVPTTVFSVSLMPRQTPTKQPDVRTSRIIRTLNRVCT